MPTGQNDALQIIASYLHFYFDMLWVGKLKEKVVINSEDFEWLNILYLHCYSIRTKKKRQL